METINNWFLIFLGNALWQALVIMAAALGCGWLMRNAPARQRHFLWVAALALCLLIPLLGASGLFRGKESTTAAKDATVVRAEYGDSDATLALITPDESIMARMRTITQPPTILMMLALACYWLSLLFHGIRMWRSWRMTKALLAASDRRAIPELLSSIKERCERSFGLRNITLLSSSQIGGPITAGKGSIILPEGLFDSDASDLLSAAIGHEMAHVKRRDFAFNLFYELLSMPLAFHPAVIFIKRRIKETRELACDELVAEKLIEAPAYARSLLQLADSAMVFNRPAYTLGIFESEILEERIMNLIERRPCLSQASKTFILAAVLSILTASSAVAAVFSYSLEQDSREPERGSFSKRAEQDKKTLEPEGGAIGNLNGDPFVYRLYFKNAPLEKILALLVKMYLKLDVMFDNSAKDLRISINIGQPPPDKQLPSNKPMEVRKVVEMVLQKEKLQAKLKDNHTLFIFADTPKNREKFAGMKPWP